jgi:hypothetical protein
MVISMRRVFSALILTSILAPALIFIPTATADPAVPDAPATTAALSVSTTSPCQGQSVHTGGADFGANETVNLTVGNRTVGTAGTNASGAFDWTVTTPDVSGRQTLAVVGQTSRHRAALTLTVRGCTATGVSGGSIGGGGGLTSFGAVIAGLCAVAAVVFSIGALVAAGRRRKSAAVA